MKQRVLWVIGGAAVAAVIAAAGAAAAPSGAHVSDGDPSVDGILGAKIPDLSDSSWRWFWTQQHGDKTTWEVTVSSRGHDHGHGQGGDDQGADEDA